MGRNDICSDFIRQIDKLPYCNEKKTDLMPIAGMLLQMQECPLFSLVANSSRNLNSYQNHGQFGHCFCDSRASYDMAKVIR